MIGEEKSPVFLLACFLESCKTPLEGARGEQFLFEAFDESEYQEKYSGNYDDCFTVRLGRRFDVGDGKNESLLLSLEMKFTPDASLKNFTEAKRFDTADALGKYAGTSPLFGYLTEQGLAAQEIELNMSYTN